MMIADAGKVDDLAIHIQAENTQRARLRSRSISLTDALRRKLDNVRLPLAGIWGERDPMTGPYVETRRELLTRLDPGSPFVVIEGAGHWVQYEASDKVNATIASWLV
jgi:2-hydroxy-6-oxonona-2,4-dienedioate hydrolase